MKRIPPRTIVLSGGGIRCLSHIGALLELEKHDYLNNVKEYIGVSAGAFISFALCIGYTLNELCKFILEFDFSNIQNVDPDNLINFLETYGLDDGRQLEKLIHLLLKYKGLSHDITFLQLFNLRPQLYFRCYATDLNTCMLKEFSHTLTPDVDIVFGLRCSMCIPGYFIPLKDPYSNHYLSDGGLIANYPLFILDNAKQTHTLGITVSEDINVSKNIDSVYDYFMQVYMSYSITKRKLALESNKKNTIVIPSSESEVLNFNINIIGRQKLINDGTQAVKDFLTLKSLASGRRRSI